MTALKGKTALVTGGSKGIGYGIVASLLSQGMHVAFTARSEEGVAGAEKDLAKTGNGEVIGIVADVRKTEDQIRAVEQVIKKWGKLDVLVANAGVGHFTSIETMTNEEWHAMIDTNLTGVFYSVKAAVAELKKSKGYIITIGSLAGTNFFEGGSAYNASKFGIVGFSQAIMLDLRQSGVKVTTIMPGSVATWFNDHEPNPADAWKIQPEDIGRIVVDLLEMHPRTLPSKIEVRPSIPPRK